MENEHKSRYELFLEEEEARKAQPTKRCSKCGEVKALGEYHKDGNSRLGVRSQCRRCQQSRKYKSREDRFWKFYHNRTIKTGQCIEWQGSYTNGYPSCGKSRSMVRRLVYQYSIGELPDDWKVTTTCNNVRCVRHSHLKAITKDEMQAILYNVNRIGKAKCPEKWCRGSSNGNAKLTEADVRVIRSLFPIKSQSEIARMFRVSSPNVSDIVNRKTWKHVE